MSVCEGGGVFLGDDLRFRNLFMVCSKILPIKINIYNSLIIRYNKLIHLSESLAVIKYSRLSDQTIMKTTRR